MTEPAGPAALVFGGTGAVGTAIVEALATRGVPTAFTYHRSKERAETLARLPGARALAVDLAQPEAIRRVIRGLDVPFAPPTVFIHAAALSRGGALGELADADWSALWAVNVTSALVAAQELAPRMATRGGGDLVFLGGLDRTQSVVAPVGYATTQGALSAMTMALAKELGAGAIRVNMLAVGILNQGLSRDLAPQVLDDYRRFSALRRTGTPAEIARAVLWLALDNRYMTGRVVPVNGGL